MKLKLTKGRVETFIKYIDPLANRALLDDFRHDWLTMEAEVERLSKIIAGMDCRHEVYIGPQPEPTWGSVFVRKPNEWKNCGQCDPCLERARNDT